MYFGHREMSSESLKYESLANQPKLELFFIYTLPANTCGRIPLAKVKEEPHITL